MIDLVDEIAYNHHDVDDGLEAGLLDLDDLAQSVSLFRGSLEQAQRRLRGASQRQIQTEALRSMIDTLVSDLIETTRDNAGRLGVQSVDDVRRSDVPLVGLSSDVATANSALKRYLEQNLYRHQRIERMKDKARRILGALYERYLANTRLLPDDFQRRLSNEPLERIIADYIAGMTDRYAIEEFQRLFDPSVRA